ncbi:hypothetical protein AX769_17215 [Frondihabitans sp. PAMC 28766]|uniref:MFS transporter n=1 Tax=Frondihabitans sp. PAMC 28766 TaxID=1795630 RepID=UPI00078D5EE6|nr:MFS transporter [Frondihabitans sp. PAMC 28766]AMM21562.1 hypothetical protein AX769_17215 [Frondihabitans sp. PAMC 28766]
MVAKHSGVTRLPRSFTSWAITASLSDVGDNAMYFALVWAATAHGGASAGLVVSAITIPRTVLLLLGGVMADRTGPRAVMLACDAALFTATAALAIASWRLGSPLWLLLTGAFAVGVVTAFYLPASSSMPRRLVSDSLVPRAVAVRQSGLQLAELSGGPLGGVLAAGLGFAAAAGINAFSFVPVLVVMVKSRTIRAAPAAEGPRRSVPREVASGLALAVSQPLIRVGLLLSAAAVIVVTPTGSVLIPLLVRQQHWAAAAAGLTLGAESVGGVVVALAVARVGTFSRPGGAAAAGLAVAAVGVALLAVSPSPAGVGAALVLGAGVALFTSHAFPLILTGTRPDHLSRVQSLLSIVQAVVLIPAAPLIGLSANDAGVASTLVICAGVLAAAAGVALLVSSWRDSRAASASDSTAD